MATGTPCAAHQLLGRDVQELFNTDEVLKIEFQLIHGKGKWNPDGLSVDQARRELNSAAAPVGGQSGPDRALHALSVRNLGNPGQAALCLSGGGVRSAAFGLGILQGLARRGLLDRFHYLSTVSGGGYIASWLTAWRHRSTGDEVLERLKRRKFEEVEEPVPFGRLRFNQNFLTPKIGLASPDTWTALGAVLRNLLLNWLVFLPLLAGLLLVPRIVQAFFVWIQQDNPFPSPSLKSLLGPWLPNGAADNIRPLAEIAHWAHWRCWLDTAAIVLIVAGFSVSAYNRPANGRTSLTQRQYLRRVVLPVVAGAVLLSAAVGSWADQMSGTWTETLRWVILGGGVYVLARIIAALRAAARFRETPQKWALPLELIGWAVAGMCTGLLVAIGARLCRSLVVPAYAPLLAPITMHELARYIAVFGPPWIVSCFLIGEVVYTGVTSRLPYGERDREWLARAGGWFGIVAAPYFVFSGLVLFGWEEVRNLETAYFVSVGGSGLLAIIGALSPLTRPVTVAAREKFPVTRVVAVLSGVFVLIASAGLAHVTLNFLYAVSLFLHDSLAVGPEDCFRALVNCPSDSMFPPGVELVFIVLTAALLLAGSAIISFFVNVNFFSLHAFYRNRLVKTFLGASNVTADPKDEERNAFDGFSRHDNLGMAELYHSDKMQEGEVKLYPVLNIALNLLATKNLAWQERKAESFVSTPLFTGGHRVGYRPSALYSAGWWGSLQEPQKGISLGTAMAISGAAVSPNWGYHSSPITSFLMMLANVRLGAWLGNPRHRATWRYSGPRFSWRLFLQEALGRTDDEEPWIYLSDGGHFENLGLYEMVRRRCRTIVVADAGADPRCTLEDLGNAVRKVAVDLGVKIDFRRILVRKRSDVAVAGVYCALGDIQYPEGVCGKIVYFKPGFYGTGEPADVRAYAAANAKFPHESTLNQWFGESQFESYRSLGAYVIEEICKRKCKNPDDNLDLSEFVRLAEEHLKEFEQNHVNDGAMVVDIRRRVTVAAAD